MKSTRKTHMPRLLAICAVIVLALGLATAAYAADVGGIRRTIQIWVHGDQTDAILELNGDGSYDLTYTDEAGELHEQQGGGAAFDIFGRERPLTEAEILEHLDAPEVIYEDDGSVWVYYHSQRLEITDKFDDGVCYVQVRDGGSTLYLTVKYDGGFAYGAHGYASPHSFN